MLQAIEGAKTSIGLSTYIFDGAGGGKQFVDALGQANHRGLEVRVLIDAVGANYSWPPVARRLRELGECGAVQPTPDAPMAPCPQPA